MAAEFVRDYVIYSESGRGVINVDDNGISAFHSIWLKTAGITSQEFYLDQRANSGAKEFPIDVDKEVPRVHRHPRSDIRHYMVTKKSLDALQNSLSSVRRRVTPRAVLRRQCQLHKSARFSVRVYANWRKAIDIARRIRGPRV